MVIDELDLKRLIKKCFGVVEEALENPDQKTRPSVALPLLKIAAENQIQETYRKVSDSNFDLLQNSCGGFK